MEAVDDKRQKYVDNKLTWISDKSKESTVLTNKIKSNHQRYVNVVDKLETIKSEATKLTNEFKSKEKAIDTKLAQAERFYNQSFLPLKQKIESNDRGLKKAIQQGDAFFKEIEKKRLKLFLANEKYTKNTTELNSTLRDIRRIGGSSATNEKHIKANKDKIENYYYEAQKQLTLIKKNYQETTALKLDIDKLLADSQDEFKEITELKKKAVIHELDIQKIKDEAISTNDQITTLFGFANNTVIAGAFDDRRKKLDKKLGKWHLKIIIATILLFAAVTSLLIFQIYLNDWDIKGLGFDFYLRFVFVTPILYYLIFCNSQYKHTQKMLDKYSYKTTVALSMEAHTQLLNKNFTDPEFKRDILGFSLDALNKVYDRPYVDELLMAKIKERDKKEDKRKDKEPVSKAIQNELASKNSELRKELKAIFENTKSDIK